MRSPLGQPIRQKPEPCPQRQERAVIMPAEDEHVAHAQQKSEILDLPIAGITREKQDKNLKSLPPQCHQVFPTPGGFRMRQHPRDHRMSPELSQILGFVAAENPVARIVEEMIAFQMFK